MKRQPYYGPANLQAIDAIEAWGLGFCLGNVVKYVARAGKKDPKTRAEDLGKALWYLKREIQREGQGMTDHEDTPCRKCGYAGGVDGNPDFYHPPQEAEDEARHEKAIKDAGATERERILERVQAMLREAEAKKFSQSWQDALEQVETFLEGGA